MPEVHEFNPDWTIAPAAMLQEWISENGLTIRILSVVAGSEVIRDDAGLILAEVMNREPLTERHAEVLASATKIPARMWLALERNYRDDLDRGRKDVTWD